MTRLAILNDYQDAARATADWTTLPRDVDITVFHEALPEDEAQRAMALEPFDVICMMRERTPMPRSLLERLPNLKLLTTTAMVNRQTDMAAARELGITVCGSGGAGNGTAELTWGLIIGLARHISAEHQNMREGRWQLTLGDDLIGHTLGLLGLGNIGARVAKVAQAFGMDVIAWSQNLTEERAREAGVRLVSRQDLFAQADYLSVHVVLSDRSRGLVSAQDLARMKRTAYFINTSRGPIVHEDALIEALQGRRIAGAGLDVYDIEPLPKNHPLLALDNVLLTPHLGFVTRDAYAKFYGDTVENVAAFLNGKPIRVLNA
ncbi:MAG TPA: D-2-hydroxyacid dehydrogenase family protein [Dehalococcoidia bacterium]|nr:D-2-hydroxyacid dehydrogenase family protein [Dehalococcoidia bacterium]